MVYNTKQHFKEFLYIFILICKLICKKYIAKHINPWQLFMQIKLFVNLGMNVNSLAFIWNDHADHIVICKIENLKCMH